VAGNFCSQAAAASGRDAAGVLSAWVGCLALVGLHHPSHPLHGLCPAPCSPGASAASEQPATLAVISEGSEDPSCKTPSGWEGSVPGPWPCSDALSVPSAARGTGNASDSSCSDGEAADAGAASAGCEEESAGTCAA